MKIQLTGENKKEMFPSETRGSERSDPGRVQSTCYGSFKTLAVKVSFTALPKLTKLKLVLGMPDHNSVSADLGSAPFCPLFCLQVLGEVLHEQFFVVPTSLPLTFLFLL